MTLPVDTFYKPINELNKDINSKTTFTLALFGLFSSIVVLMAITTSLFIAKRVVEPINNTIDVIESILDGDYTVKVPESGMVEIDKLAEVISRLVNYFEKSKNGKEG